MAHTNNTPHYELPQFIASDKGTWLGDLNEAFLKIDSQMFDNAQQVTLSNSTADNAKEVAQTTAQGLASMNTVVNKNTADIANNSRSIGDTSALPTGYSNCVGAIKANSNNISQNNTKIATMNNTLSAVESSVNDNIAELGNVQQSINTINSNIGSKTILPTPSASTNQNVANLNTAINSVKNQLTNVLSTLDKMDEVIKFTAKLDVNGSQSTGFAFLCNNIMYVEPLATSYAGTNIGSFTITLTPQSGIGAVTTDKMTEFSVAVPCYSNSSQFGYRRATVTLETTNVIEVLFTLPSSNLLPDNGTVTVPSFQFYAEKDL